MEKYCGGVYLRKGMASFSLSLLVETWTKLKLTLWTCKCCQHNLWLCSTSLYSSLCSFHFCKAEMKEQFQHEESIHHLQSEVASKRCWFLHMYHPGLSKKTLLKNSPPLHNLLHLLMSLLQFLPQPGGAGGVGTGGGVLSPPDSAAEGSTSSIPWVQCSHCACVNVHLPKNMHRFKRLAVTQQSILWDRMWSFVEEKGLVDIAKSFCSKRSAEILIT